MELLCTCLYILTGRPGCKEAEAIDETPRICGQSRSMVTSTPLSKSGKGFKQAFSLISLAVNETYLHWTCYDCIDMIEDYRPYSLATSSQYHWEFSIGICVRFWNSPYLINCFTSHTFISFVIFCQINTKTPRMVHSYYLPTEMPHATGHCGHIEKKAICSRSYGPQLWSQEVQWMMHTTPYKSQLSRPKDRPNMCVIHHLHILTISSTMSYDVWYYIIIINIHFPSGTSSSSCSTRPTSSTTQKKRKVEEQTYSDGTSFGLI